MIQISLLDDKKLIKEIITSPKLFALTYGQSLDPHEYEVQENWGYLLASWDHQPIGLFQTKELTAVTLEAHIYVLPRYWGTELPEKISEAGFEFIRHNTYYEKIFTDVPLECKSVHRLVEKLGWKCCGNIPNGCSYNKKTQDLVLYYYDLYPSKHEEKH